MTADVTPFLNNITSEHRDKSLFVQMVTATVQPFADMIAQFNLIPSLYNVDVAVGQQLDTVGQWVGVSRFLITPLTGVYFAFDTAGVGFDEGVWQGPYDTTTGLFELPDDSYRLVIKARILNNNWDSTKLNAYAIANVLFGPAGFNYYIEDYGDLTIGIGLLGATAPPAILTALFNSGLLDVKGVTIRVISRVAQQGPVFSFDIDNLLFKGFDESFWAVSV